MDIFSIQIIDAIKKIRTQKGRPDSEKIFKEVVKESATNITLAYFLCIPVHDLGYLIPVSQNCLDVAVTLGLQ